MSVTSSDLSFKILPMSIQRSAVEKLRSAIITGFFGPGDRLVEAYLCELLGISRTSVREALRSLEAERLIEIVPNRGPLVRVLSWEEAAEIYEVRAILEGEAAALFARHATPEQLKNLETALKGFEQAVARDDPAARLAETGKFYAVISAGSRNRIIEEILTGLQTRISFLRYRSMSLTGRSKQSAEEMRRIQRAIAAGDEKKARSAAMDHVTRACAAAKIGYDTGNAGNLAPKAQAHTLPKRAKPGRKAPSKA